MASIKANNVMMGAAAVGVGVVVGAGIAYLGNRVLYSRRVAQEKSLLHDNIVEMKQNLKIIERELETLHSRPINSIIQRNDSNSKKAKRRKNVSFSSSISEASYTTAADGDTILTSSSYHTALDNGQYDTDYFSPDEDEEEFYDFLPSDSEDQLQFHGRKIWEDTAATELTRLLKTVDALFSSGEEADVRAAHDALVAAEPKFNTNSEVLWRLAKSFRNLSSLEEKNGNDDMKKNYIFEAHIYAERSLSANDGCADTHKWYAITSGARGEYLSTKERIESGRQFKKHIDAALTLNPNDASLHHLLGRFCYEVSGLSWLEKKAAAAFFGAVPESTYNEALQHFMAAEDLNARGWKENRLFIVKCLIKLNELDNIPSWIMRALDLPTASADDIIVEQQLKELQVQYGTPML